MNNLLKLEYIWIDGRGEIRSKLRVVRDNNVNISVGFTQFPNGWNWNYDGRCEQNEQHHNGSELSVHTTHLQIAVPARLLWLWALRAH